MNCNKGHNVFSDIPGFDASKSERIYKALQKLWKKIEYLEQIRHSEKRCRSKETQTNSKDRDLTITDIQYKLLILQLQYARSVLIKNRDKNNIGSHSENNEIYKLSGSYNERKNECSNTVENKTISQATQTVKSELAEPTPSIDSGSSTYETETNLQMLADHHPLKSGRPLKNSTSVINKVAHSKPHYHMKLDDVPFILGASSTASHSVVANVQNIISMMKSHNKVLCGPRNVSRPPSMNVHRPEDNQDATEMLNKLSDDLCELALKQQKLLKSIDAGQKKNKVAKKTEKEKKYTAEPSVKMIRSNSESELKLHAEVKNFVQSNVHRQKNKLEIQKNTLSTKHLSSNLPIMERRKLLRSLQNFKSHLSEEDISWN